MSTAVTAEQSACRHTLLISCAVGVSSSTHWLSTCTDSAEVEPENFYIGGKSNSKFVRIVSQHLARTNTSPEREERVSPVLMIQRCPIPVQPRHGAAPLVLLVSAVPVAARQPCPLDRVIPAPRTNQHLA